METKKKKPHINVDFFEDLTGDISESTPTGVEEIGKRIKTLREEKGLSLDELSNLTGFDVELLSNIETSKVQPQLGQNVCHNTQKRTKGCFQIHLSKR
jgi:ribosome-binding protein aMBF1 (putative translation factor)